MLEIDLLFFSIPLKWIHLRHTRITRLFAREKFSFQRENAIGIRICCK